MTYMTAAVSLPPNLFEVVLEMIDGVRSKLSALQPSVAASENLDVAVNEISQLILALPEHSAWLRARAAEVRRIEPMLFDRRESVTSAFRIELLAIADRLESQADELRDHIEPKVALWGAAATRAIADFNAALVEHACAEDALVKAIRALAWRRHDSDDPIEDEPLSPAAKDALDRGLTAARDGQFVERSFAQHLDDES